MKVLPATFQLFLFFVAANAAGTDASARRTALDQAMRQNQNHRSTTHPTGFGDGFPEASCLPAYVKVLPDLNTTKFIFSVNAGHSGSTAFGSLETFKYSPQQAGSFPPQGKGNVCNTFEAFHYLNDRKVCSRGRDLGRDLHHASINRVTTVNQFRGGGHIPLHFLPENETLMHPCGLHLRAALTFLTALAKPTPSASLCTFASMASETVFDFFERTKSRKAFTPKAKSGKGSRFNPGDTCTGRLQHPTALFFDFGHATLFGLGDAFVRTLGFDRVSFVRIRRSRHANAVSYFTEGKVPCNGLGTFVLCPFDHGSVLLRSDPEWVSKWNKLNGYQRCLFLIDEVEARWTAFMTQHPNMEIHEVDWESVGDVAAGLQSTAAFMDEQVSQDLHITVNPVQLQNRRHHVSPNNNTGGSAFSAAYYKDCQTRYLEIMAYTDAQLDLIKKQLSL